MGRPSKENTADTAAGEEVQASTETADTAVGTKASKGKVKVIANYGVRDERITLWGIDFVQEGDKYTAELPEEQATELIDAGRAIKA